jgi:uncharacterized caspase-like protein
MTRIIFRVTAAIFGAVLAVFLVDDAFAQRRVALVIGNSAYQNVAQLGNTRSDADAIAGLLRKAGFDVVDARQDLGVVDFKRALRDFMTVARGAETAVMYFAGHGIESAGTNYLIPVDAKLATDYDAEDEAVSLDRIILALEPARRLRLVILDACRDNPFARKMQRTVAVRAVNTGLGKVEIMSTDTLVAYAAKAGSVSYDGFGPHSPFTTALLKHIGEPGLDIRIALGRVRDEVLKITSSKQEPFVYGSLGGTTIALVPGPEAKKAEPAPVATEVDVRRAYEAAAEVGTKEAWQSFINRHPTGFYAELARLQLQKLNAAGAAEAVAEREAKAQAEQQAKLRAEQEAKARADQEAKARAEREAKARAEQEEKARAERERAERLALAQRQEEERRKAAEAERIKAEQEAKARAEREAKARAEQEAKARAEREAKARAEQEAKVRAEREAKARADQEAKARAEREAKARADQEAKARAEQQRVERLALLQRQEEERQAKEEAERRKARAEQEGNARAEQERAQRLALQQREEERRAKEEAERRKAQREAALRAQEKVEPAPEQSCASEEKRLVRLRANPARDEVVRFARELHCAELRPQVNRLLESLGGAPAALAPVPPPPAAREQAPQPAPVVIERRESKPGGEPDRQQACRHDEERLAQLRANPVRDAVARFARELTCEDLRPQVQRLLESVGG